MQQIKNVSVDSLPKTGYLVSNEEKKEKFYKNESHINRQGPLRGLKAGAHKLTNDIFTYFPKGFAGSKNSDFYEFISMGMVPSLIGSIFLAGTYGFANHKFNARDAKWAGMGFNKMASGVILYAVGKWAYQKLARTAIKASTAVDLDMQYVKKINELPEPGQEKGLVRTQYPGVYDSVQFYRCDLLAKDAELNHNNLYYYDDKIIKKAGYKKKLNAPNQTASDAIRKVKARTTALEYIGKYIVAATGVALGSQEAFENIDFKKPKTIVDALKEGAVQLWKGTDRNVFTKYAGKALVIGSAAATLLTWLIPTIKFKHKPDTVKTKIDTKKEFEVC